ncbi:MAG TPA: hypothetical protein VJ715_04750 [Pyrinomonadaceae bacterium]|nr:hypothetical protein [Pyrinomonadaceae bacterium]
MSRKGRRCRTARVAVSLVAFLSIPLYGFLLPSNFSGTAAAGTMQLVRLNVVSEAGFVRIEITADGSFEDATVEHYSRGRQTVIRIRGARSLLRQSYVVDDALASEVRTVAGERDGEPYVDVMITLGDGATVAQKKNFNRLVIGVAADFARLRRRAPANATTEVAKARSSSTEKGSVQIEALPMTDELNERVADAGRQRPAVNYAAAVPAAQTTGTTSVLASSAPQTIFRGRTIWGELPVSSFRFPGSAASGFAPTFFLPSANAASPAPGFFNFIPMAMEPPGATPGVWVPGSTAAERDEVGGRPFGGGYLRPSVQLGATYDDNFFYRSADGRHLTVLKLAPRLEYEIPGVTHALRIAYEARLRRLTTGHWANGHTLDLDARFEVTPFVRLAVRDHFVRSALDPREFDPAGEVYIVGDTFNRNDAGVRAEFLLNPRSRLAFEGGYNLVRWSKDHIAGAPLFVDYEELKGGIAFERDISEVTTGFVSFNYANTVSDVPFRPQFDALGHFRRYQFELGARTQVSETSGMAFRLGYERDVFKYAPEVNNFSSLIFDYRFRRAFSDNTFLELAGLRKTQLSAFNLEGGNARLLSTGGSARLETTQGGSLKLALGVNYQQLNFPVRVVPNSTASGGVTVGQFAGFKRDDHLYGFSAEAGFRFSDLLKTRLVYSFQRRDSTIPIFTFNRNRLSLIFEFGRRNEVRGRPF